jgi:hypothetical protein
MLEKIIKCFGEEMEAEELGEIRDEEGVEAVLKGKIIEDYPEDKPYPSCLVYGKTSDERPLHIVCAYAKDVNKAIIITVYQPRSDQWIDFERRKK